MHSRMFNRWICITHDCGSYKFKNLVDHEIPSCEIITVQTVGVIKPKTWGGFNGDVSRKYIPEWINFHREKQMQENALENWRVYRAKVSQNRKRYDKKFKGIFQYKRKKY